MNILLYGNGFIGQEFIQHIRYKHEIYIHDYDDIRDYNEVVKRIQIDKPDYIINAAGITGKPNVDWCERNVGETLSVNVGGSINIAKAAYDEGIKVMQLGSGCIYQGGIQYEFTEEDPPNFFGSVYSRSCIHREMCLREFPNVLILRIRIPIIGRKHPKNLIDKLIAYPKIINYINSCTIIEDFIPAALQMMDRGFTGVFNMTNQGALNHGQIMDMYREIVNPNFKLQFMDEEEQEELCKRRSNCVLSTKKREDMGINMPSLGESLKKVLKNYAKEHDPPHTHQQ